MSSKGLNSKDAQMDFISKAVPAFLYKKGNQVAMVVFAAIFALVFINLYNPFEVRDWGARAMTEQIHLSDRFSEFLFVVFSSAIVLCGLLVVALSRVIMTYFCKHRTMTYGIYILWVLCEVSAMSALYTVFTITLGMQTDVWIAFRASFINTVLVLLLPYSLCIIFFSLQDKAQQLKKISAEMENAGHSGLISFYDERGELRLSVKNENLLLLEAADNYVCVWYLSNGEPRKVMVRTSLKRLSQEFADSTSIIRCHRSYMVNIGQVKIVRREKDGAYLDFGIEGVQNIPVSQTYNDSITRWLVSGERPVQQ